MVCFNYFVKTVAFSPQESVGLTYFKEREYEDIIKSFNWATVYERGAFLLKRKLGIILLLENRTVFGGEQTDH